MKTYKFDLQMFSIEGSKDFFISAFNEAYSINEGSEDTTDNTEVPSEQLEEPTTPSNDNNDTLPTKEDKPSYNPNDEELKRLYEERFGKVEEKEEYEDNQEVDEETQSALELYKYLEKNPHLVQAMRDIDEKGFNELNNYVPDELTKKVKELEDYIEEQRYKDYVSELKQKFSDFDENSVLEFANKHDVYDLEIAYKAMKADTYKAPDMDAIRKQVKEEIMNELKQNSLQTQTIVGGISQKPISQDDEVKLTKKEQEIALAMGVSPSEYAKWR